MCQKEYTKNLKIPGYNNLVSRQLLIKFEEGQMKKKEMHSLQNQTAML